MDPTIVNSVFDGVIAGASGGKALMNTFTSTCDAVNAALQQPQQPAFGGGTQIPMYSRRDDVHFQQPQPQYQPSAYPWASQSYGYGFGQQTNQFAGYQGITNPNYGKSGYFTGNYSFNGFNGFSQQPMNQEAQMFNRTTWGGFR